MEKLIFSTIFVILVPLVSFLAYREIKFFREAVILSGKVINLKSSHDNDGMMYAPDIDVNMPDGTILHYSHETYSKPASFSVGEIVPMGYDGNRLAIMLFWNRCGLVFVFSTILMIMVFYVIAKIAYEKAIINAIAAQSIVEKR